VLLGSEEHLVLPRLMRSIFKSYFNAADPKFFLSKKNSSDMNDPRALNGYRVMVHDFKVNTRLEDVDAFSCKNFEEFTTMPQLTIAMTSPPPDGAIREDVWECLIVFPLPKTEEPQSKTLFPSLEKESAGIFNWLLDGYRVCLENNRRFLETAEMRKARDELWMSSDDVENFVRNKLEVAGKEDYIGAAALFEKYREYCKENDSMPLSGSKFKRAMIEKEYEQRTITSGAKAGSRAWYGLRLQGNSQSTGSVGGIQENSQPVPNVPLKSASQKNVKLDDTPLLHRQFTLENAGVLQSVLQPTADSNESTTRTLTSGVSDKPQREETSGSPKIPDKDTQGAPVPALQKNKLASKHNKDVTKKEASPSLETDLGQIVHLTLPTLPSSSSLAGEPEDKKTAIGKEAISAAADVTNSGQETASAASPGNTAPKENDLHTTVQKDVA
jgi:hypothetical protein